MNTSMDVCDELGVVIAENKTIGPLNIITFLGFIIDKVLMMVRIPEEKLKKYVIYYSHCCIRKRYHLRT